MVAGTALQIFPPSQLPALSECCSMQVQVQLLLACLLDWLGKKWVHEARTVAGAVPGQQQNLQCQLYAEAFSDQTLVALTA